MTAFVAVRVFSYPTLAGALAGGQGDVNKDFDIMARAPNAANKYLRAQRQS